MDYFSLTALTSRYQSLTLPRSTTTTTITDKKFVCLCFSNYEWISYIHTTCNILTYIHTRSVTYITHIHTCTLASSLIHTLHTPTSALLLARWKTCLYACHLPTLDADRDTQIHDEYIHTHPSTHIPVKPSMHGIGCLGSCHQPGLTRINIHTPIHKPSHYITPPTLELSFPNQFPCLVWSISLSIYICWPFPLIFSFAVCLRPSASGFCYTAHCTLHTAHYLSFPIY
ncbi:hypothetical protein M752DRAFT_146940 [Aspergillus phoenicis ATCC 13157]|uniref:Uncharacterized protein n=1 Tax=Aspergillus phoenicis ATCC 13157 TaxID=1353007 RepID=A0A370PNY5_ASPPH|nr:hypothetical protein M752DRAFT_146940 [Aspergillus phoenicis ATCC 13157]